MQTFFPASNRILRWNIFPASAATGYLSPSFTSLVAAVSRSVFHRPLEYGLPIERPRCTLRTLGSGLVLHADSVCLHRRHTLRHRTVPDRLPSNRLDTPRTFWVVLPKASNVDNREMGTSSLVPIIDSVSRPKHCAQSTIASLNRICVRRGIIKKALSTESVGSSQFKNGF